MINNAKNYIKGISKPSFILQKIFSKNFVAIHEIKPVLILLKVIVKMKDEFKGKIINEIVGLKSKIY